MADIFVSYASEDRDRAQSLAEALGREGYDVWWDRTIPPGRVFDEVIQEALQGARSVVVLWSEASTRSNWVKAEADDALSRGKLVPVLIAPVLPPFEFRRIQAANLAQWSGDHDDPEYRTLLGAIRQQLKRGHADRAHNAVAGEPVARPGGVTRPRIVAAAALLVLLGVASIAWRFWSVGESSSSQAFSAAPSKPNPPDGHAAEPSVVETTSGTSRVPTQPGASAARSGGERINLLASSSGGELVLAPNERWSATIDGRDDTYAYVDAGEGVYGFKDGRAATFNAFAVLIPSTSDINLGTFELLAGNDLRGSFRSIGTFTTENVRIMREPYQEFTFAPVTAKYLKVRALKNHTGGTVAAAYEFRVYGTLR
jgi:hypothetical protein